LPGIENHPYRKKIFYLYVKKKLESTIQNFIFAGIEWKPLNNVQISKNKLEATTVFLETLEDNDDVQSVYTNLKFINN